MIVLAKHQKTFFIHFDTLSFIMLYSDTLISMKAQSNHPLALFLAETKPGYVCFCFPFSILFIKCFVPSGHV